MQFHELSNAISVIATDLWRNLFQVARLEDNRIVILIQLFEACLRVAETRDDNDERRVARQEQVEYVGNKLASTSQVHIPL